MPEVGGRDEDRPAPPKPTPGKPSAAGRPTGRTVLPTWFLTAPAGAHRRRQRPHLVEEEPPDRSLAVRVLLGLIAIVAAVISGILLALAQTDGGVVALALIAFLPVALVLRPDRPFRCIGLLGVVAALETALSLSWIQLHGTRYALAVLLAAGYSVVMFAVPAAMCCRLARSRGCPATGLLGLPAGWALGEVGARRFGAGVTWTTVGLPMADWPLFSRAVAFAGPESLSFLALGVSVAIALALRRAPIWATVVGSTQGPMMVLAVLLLGLSVTDEPAGNVPLLRVGVIQPNFPQSEAWTGELRERRLRFLDSLIDQTRAGRPDLLVLPEGAVNGLVRYDDRLTAWVKSVVTRTHRSLLFGSLDRQQDGTGLSNVAILITPFETVSTYRKMRLVPLSERLIEAGPLRAWSKAVRGGAIVFDPGTEHTVFELSPRVRFSTPICYEDGIPDLARQFTLAGARLLISLINTERFNGTSQPGTHLRRSRLAAAAVGLPVLRCANSGITCLLAPDGREVARVENDRKEDRGFAASVVFAVPLIDRPTTYRRFGDRLPLGLGILTVASLILLGRAHDRRQDRAAPPGDRPAT